MKTRLFALCMLILILSGIQQPVGAADTPPGRAITDQQARQRVADWTVLVYMSADNDLERYVAGDGLVAVARSRATLDTSEYSPCVAVGP